VADGNTDVDFSILSHWLSGITRWTKRFKHTRIFVIPLRDTQPQRTDKIDSFASLVSYVKIKYFSLSLLTV
jgi:hypothetical protein